MQLPPPEVLLSWPAPNYVDPEIRSDQLLVITCVLIPIALLTVGLRCVTRVLISKSFGLDDWLLLIAVIPTAAGAVLSVLAFQRWGWNRHTWDVPPSLITLDLKLTIIIECAFCLAVALTKVSMLVWIRRVLVVESGIMHFVSALLMFICAIGGLVFCFVVIFTCSPPSEYWTPSHSPQKCVNEELHLVISGIINTFTDFGVVLLTLILVSRLKNINRNQRITLGVLFGAGFAICVAGVFRTYFEFKSANTFDRTWASFGLWTSSAIELYIGVICTAISGCEPFFSRYLPKSVGTSKGIGSQGEDFAATQYYPPQQHTFQSHVPFYSHEQPLDLPDRDIPFSLKRIPLSKFNSTFFPSSVNTQYLSPLSYTDTPSELDPHKVKIDFKASSGTDVTSISSFIGSNPSSDVPDGMHRSGPAPVEGITVHAGGTKGKEGRRTLYTLFPHAG